MITDSFPVAEAIFPAVTRRWLWHGAVACVAACAATGWAMGWLVLGALVSTSLARGSWTAPAVAALVALAGLLGAQPSLAPGPLQAAVELQTEPRPGISGTWAVASMDSVEVFIELPESSGHQGDRLAVEGRVSDRTTVYNGRRLQIVRAERVTLVGSDPDFYTRAGRALRNRVVSRLGNESEASGLLAGFLVGDTSGVSPVTVEAMKKAGLSHFVAVSGSNVALFLGFVAVLAIPLGVGAKRRAVAGLFALPVFVIATGFEPSVIRAAAMASVVLLGKIADVVLDVWQVVSVSAVVVLVLDPWLINSVGFQLSLAATCGVIVGARWPDVEGMIRRGLAVTMGAQVAVSPLLLAHFGSIPLLSPLSNLVAAPLVTGSTVLALAGVSGVGLALGPARWGASIVIEISHMAAGWPQVGWLGLGAALLGAAVFVRWWDRHRSMVALVGAALLLTLLVPHPRTLQPGEVVVLDVGQGDAILLAGGSGRYALVDGGRDPALLLEGLRRYGVHSLDLVVMTHGDADHAGGLSGLPGRVAIGEIWERIAPHRTEASDLLLGLAAEYGIPVAAPGAGSSSSLGDLDLEVLGPGRRFASPNDQSIVILVEGEQSTMLLTGDLEVVGQRELPPMDIDVLKVPHHGAGTSDDRWLGSLGAELAIISVGENDFGHPIPWVLETLQQAGASVRRTDFEGDIVVDLGAPVSSLLSWSGA